MKTKCIRYYINPNLLGVVPFEQIEKKHIEEFSPPLWNDLRWNGKNRPRGKQM